jgi:AmmeMemoRadiSam system protein B/AmmeMemoRadiSam system protein A
VRLWAPATGRTGGTRPPAVAGRFYPGRSDDLGREVDAHVAAARAVLAERGDQPQGRLVAVVAPHAGYVYSGPTAGFAYASIDPQLVDRVVLLGPAHYVPVDGMGLSSAAAWRTPLGEVPLDEELAAQLAAEFDSVLPADGAHAPEHSLEVQVPFLQRVLREPWRLLPLIVGADLPGEVAAVITRCAALPGTLVVVSTDLSHYLDHATARAQDRRTIEAVLARRPASIGTSDACGRHPLRGLLTAAAAQDWTVHLLDARNSGDTAGDRSRVVGYAAFAVTAGSADQADRSGDAAEPVADQVGEAAERAPGPDPQAAAGGPELTGPELTGPELTGPELIGPESRAALLRLARRTIEQALAAGGRRPVLPVADWSGSDPVLTAPGAAFVTLRSASGALLGCIGSLAARQPLVADVAEHAFDAAFRDPRFPPMDARRAADMVIDISVLSPTRPWPCSGYDDLVARVQPGTGLVVEAGGHRATFLPAVWDQLPEPAAFVAALWRKAGLRPGDWPHGTRIEVYDSQEFAER